jgi:hypothetical protein
MFTFAFLQKRGRAMAQAVSCLPNVAAHVRCQVRSCGICGRQSGTGEDFVERFIIWITTNYRCSSESCTAL